MELIMSFRVNNKQLLKNYNKIWEKGEKLMRIDFQSKPEYKNKDICGQYDYEFSQ